jgi:hypothetical protein
MHAGENASLFLTIWNHFIWSMWRVLLCSLHPLHLSIHYHLSHAIFYFICRDSLSFFISVLFSFFWSKIMKKKFSQALSIHYRSNHLISLSYILSLLCLTALLLSLVFLLLRGYISFDIFTFYKVNSRSYTSNFFLSPLLSLSLSLYIYIYGE